MDDEVPSWLDETFLASALQGGEDQGPTVTVENFSVRPAVAAGNNYTSHLYRVFVEYKVGQSDRKETISLIVKMPIQKGVMLEMSEETNFFSKEPQMYNVILPKMNEICQIEFGPKSFNCPVKHGMVIQDLKPEGYILIDRFKQLDFEHCKLVMEKLGKFHATSVVCHHDDPSLIETVGKESFYFHGSVMEDQMKIWVSSTMKLFTNALQENELDPAHLALITARIEGLWDSMVDICKPHSDSLNVLNHGDCWSSNMLFKYDESGCLSDVMFIDFQICRYSSPITDILYFIYTSANEEVRESRLRELYDIYLDTLNKTLEHLGCKERLSHEEFEEKLKLGSDFILTTIGCVLPFTKCETENALDMENFNKEDFANSDKDERFLKMYRGERFRALLPALVRQYVSHVSS